MNDKIGYIINKSTKEYKPFFSGVENLDGIVSDGKNGFYISGAWQGEIFHINEERKKKLVLDLGKDKIYAADIEYIAKKRLLIIPTLDKTVVGYKLR